MNMLFTMAAMRQEKETLDFVVSYDRRLYNLGEKAKNSKFAQVVEKIMSVKAYQTNATEEVKENEDGFDDEFNQTRRAATIDPSHMKSIT